MPQSRRCLPPSLGWRGPLSKRASSTLRRPGPWRRLLRYWSCRPRRYGVSRMERCVDYRLALARTAPARLPHRSVVIFPGVTPNGRRMPGSSLSTPARPHLWCALASSKPAAPVPVFRREYRHRRVATPLPGGLARGVFPRKRLDPPATARQRPEVRDRGAIFTLASANCAGSCSLTPHCEAWPD